MGEIELESGSNEEEPGLLVEEWAMRRHGHRKVDGRWR